MFATSDPDKTPDAELRSFCLSQENCLRTTMVRAIGGEVQERPLNCCMVCNPAAFTDGGRLDVVRGVKSVQSRRRRRAVRRVGERVTERLKTELLDERKKYIAENPSLGMIGAQLVCPDSVVSEICSNVRFISVISDLDAFCPRQELKQRFFDVIIAVVDGTPSTTTQ